ncbi:hypothetical protein OIV87_002592 [Enterococcus faecalis]|nr:hypothetical protein [Enterococcus faecalis]HAP4455972.1 hypothetical protein [Enterococcus faecalis]HBM7934005.1 hypothetical protein [Enterococcus faecalis]
MKKTEKILFLGFSALMFILIGCSNKDNLQENKKSSAVEQTANLTAATPIQSLDPATAVDQTSITLLANVMEGLYRLDKKNQAEPALAEKLPDISKDGKTYTISLRKDATWTDKTPVTAEDFVFAWQRVVDPNTASQNVGLFAPIENAEEISKGSKAKESLGGEYAKQYKSDKDYSSSLLATSMYLELNKKTKDSILKNKNLRKSISYAIDRASLVEKLLDNGFIASVGLVDKCQ